MRILIIARETLYSGPGGDTVQVENTAKFLRKLNVFVDIKLDGDEIKYADYDIVHLFNIIRPAGIYKHAGICKKPFVISTIYVDYSELEKKNRGVFFTLLNLFFGKYSVEYIKVIARHLNGSEKLNSSKYLLLGQKRSIIELLEKASYLLPNSKNEYNRLLKDFGVSQKYNVIPNAFDTSIFNENKIQPRIKREGILCVGRIEHIKNQLALIKAINQTNLTLTIIGKPAPNQLKYYKKCKEAANENILFIEHVNQAELVGYYASARVHVLPSWFETTGLSTLEAGAMGCQLVITGKGDTKDYFKDEVFYCDPDDVNSIKNAVVEANEQKNNAAITSRIRSEFIWEITAKKTLEVYKEVIYFTSN